jgi:acyl transferase domain-containing protein
MTINTACSSSLVALHEACLHLRTGQCDVAVAGGVNLILRPETTIAVSQAGMMAPDGRCKTFDDDANGYVRGEGCGMVLLKPLQKALDDGDRIVGVIRGSAVNHDGRSNGITAPSRFAQEALIGAALASAGVAPDQVSYIEAHGTGTRLGDPIEVNALKTVYGAQADGPACHIGSVKANIGHLESAAGIAGLIKVLLQIEHKTIVRQIGISQLNRYIHLDRTRLRIALENRSWADHGTAVCAVSSFSFGGTNAHVLVARPPERAQPAADEGGPLILAISGRSPAACDSLARACLAQLPAHRQPARFCASVAQTRDHFDYRRAVVALDAAQLAQTLAQDASPARQGAADAPRVAFLFSGQASQYATMGLHLYRRFEPFRRSVDGANVLFHRFHGCTTQDVLWGDKSALLDRTEYTQPALYVLQVALARLWQSLGVTPSLVLGHSVGEYAAAHIAGVFSFDEGLEMVLLRAGLMQRLGPEGNMLAIRADRQRVQAILAPCAASYQFAVFNSDGDVVISVRPQAVGQLVRLLTDAGIQSIVLKGNRPFHSDLMQAVAREFHAQIAHVGFRAPAIDMVDNISAGNDAHSAFDADYWMRQIVAPVDFAGCVRHPRIDGIDVVLEIGPGSTLLALFAKAGGTRQRPLLPSMLVSDKNAMTFFKAVGQLYEAGAEIDWAALQGDGRFVDVPGYPFERKKIFSAADPRFVPVPTGALPAPVYELRGRRDGGGAALCEQPRLRERCGRRARRFFIARAR